MPFGAAKSQAIFICWGLNLFTHIKGASDSEYVNHFSNTTLAGDGIRQLNTANTPLDVIPSEYYLRPSGGSLILIPITDTITPRNFTFPFYSSLFVSNFTQFLLNFDCWGIGPSKSQDYSANKYVKFRCVQTLTHILFLMKVYSTLPNLTTRSIYYASYPILVTPNALLSSSALLACVTTS